MNRSEQSCSNCHYYFGAQCRRKSPLMEAPHWPSIAPEEWCGCWRKIPVKKEPKPDPIIRAVSQVIAGAEPVSFTQLAAIFPSHRDEPRPLKELYRMACQSVRLKNEAALWGLMKTWQQENLVEVAHTKSGTLGWRRTNSIT